MERFILHVDVNNAFLSWTAAEMLKNGSNTDIRNIPSVIGGDEAQRRGIVLAKSPIAKQFGIKTGEPLYMARKKCPQLQVYKSDFAVYKKYSNQMIEILKKYTNEIEQCSIDECALDLTSFLLKGENIEQKAKQISDEIKQKLKFTVNIGIAHNKMLAKMASDFEKPDKIHTLYENEIETKMWPLPVSELLMVGRKTVQKLNQIGIKTIGDLAKREEKDIIKKFGKLGKTIWEYANGIDNSPVKANDNEKPKGIGNSVTMPQDVNDITKLEEVLLALCEQVAYRLRKQKMQANVVNVQIKNNQFQTYTHQKKLHTATDSTKYIYEEAKKLLQTLYHSSTNKQIRLIGIRVDTLEQEQEQISLFNQKSDNEEKQKKVDNVIDGIKDKYGYDVITRAGKMNIGKLIRLKD